MQVYKPTCCQVNRNNADLLIFYFRYFSYKVKVFKKKGRQHRKGHKNDKNKKELRSVLAQ